MALPLGVMDPIFICELALDLKMPIGELGRRMSNYELCVVWPNYYRYRQRVRVREERRQQEMAQRKGRGR